MWPLDCRVKKKEGKDGGEIDDRIGGGGEEKKSK